MEFWSIIKRKKKVYEQIKSRKRSLKNHGKKRCAENIKLLSRI